MLGKGVRGGNLTDPLSFLQVHEAVWLQQGLKSGRIGLLGQDERFKHTRNTLGRFIAELLKRNVHEGVCAGCGEMPRLPGVYA